MKKIKYTILGFKKFNPRSDLKSMPWLRLQNDFYDKEDFFDADVNTIHLYIFLLCQCAQKVSDTVEMNEKYLINKSKLTNKAFYTALSTLIDKSLISLVTNESDRVRSNPLLTNEQNEQNEPPVRVRSSDFDIEEIYKNYPVKKGKAAGIKKLQSIIKTQELYDNILLHVKRFSQNIKTSDQDLKYVKHFSSWVNQECWNDELDNNYEKVANAQNFINGLIEASGDDIGIQ